MADRRTVATEAVVPLKKAYVGHTLMPGMESPSSSDLRSSDSSSRGSDDSHPDGFHSMLNMFRRGTLDGPKTLMQLKQDISTRRFDIGRQSRRKLIDRTHSQRDRAITPMASLREEDMEEEATADDRLSSYSMMSEDDAEIRIKTHGGGTSTSTASDALSPSAHVIKAIRSMDGRSVSVVPYSPKPSTSAGAALFPVSPTLKSTTSVPVPGKPLVLKGSERSIHPRKRGKTMKRKEKSRKRMAREKEKAWMEMYTGGQQRRRGGAHVLSPDVQTVASMSSDPAALTRLVSHTVGSLESGVRPFAVSVGSGVSDTADEQSDGLGDDWCTFDLDWQQVTVCWNPFLMVSRLDAFVISVSDMIELYPADSVKSYKSAKPKMVEFRDKSFVWFFDRNQKAIDDGKKEATSVSGGCTDRAGEKTTLDVTDYDTVSAAATVSDDPTTMWDDMNWPMPFTDGPLSEHKWTASAASTVDGVASGGRSHRSSGGAMPSGVIDLSDYLNEQCHGVILALNGESVVEMPPEVVMSHLANQMSYGSVVTIGVLKGYCQFGHDSCLDWRSMVCDRIDDSSDDECFICHKQHLKRVSGDTPWLLGGSRYHKTDHTRVCGLCVLRVLDEAFDTDKLSLHQYLYRNLTRPEKVKELCLIHRLFSTSERLMRVLLYELIASLRPLLLSDSGLLAAQEEHVHGMSIVGGSAGGSRSSIAKSVHIINFVTHWIELLWNEDFYLGSESRKVLNYFISVMHRLSWNDPPDYTEKAESSLSKLSTIDSSDVVLSRLPLSPAAALEKRAVIDFESDSKADDSSVSSDAMSVFIKADDLLESEQRRVIVQAAQRLMSAYRAKYLADKQQLLKDEVELWSAYITTMTASDSAISSPSEASALSPKLSETDFDDSKVDAAELAGSSSGGDGASKGTKVFDRLLRDKRKLLEMQFVYGAEYMEYKLKESSEKGGSSALWKSFTDDDQLLEIEENNAIAEEKSTGLDEVARNARYMIRQSVRSALSEMLVDHASATADSDGTSTPGGGSGSVTSSDQLPSSAMTSTDALTKMAAGSGSLVSLTSVSSSSTARQRAAAATSSGGIFGGMFGGGVDPARIDVLRELAMERQCELIASQLTLLMYKKFRAIRPTELLSKGWTSKDKDSQSPHVVEFIFFCEAISVWVQCNIIAERPGARMQAIERMVRVGIALQKMHNQYGQLQVFAGLDSPMSQRFKVSWAQIKGDTLRPELKRFMDEGADVMSSSRNFSNIREMLWSLSTPAIPFLGIFLKDFFMVDELLKKSVIGKASPAQSEKLWSLYKKLDGFRQAPYTFEEEPQAKKFLSHELDWAAKVDMSLLSKLASRMASAEKEKAEHKSASGGFLMFGRSAAS